MISIKEKIDTDFRKDLEETVYRAAQETVESLFGSKICANTGTAADTSQTLVACVDFRQGVEGITLRLVFDFAFICALLRNIYTQDKMDARTREICEDAACELSNIICNRIKRFLNENGLFLFMELPYIERADDQNKRSGQDIINLYFSALENDRVGNCSVLSIGMSHFNS